jgi:NAD(P)-dependent dehydrogenase (short-subunit alcohol dehydrogenase family)
MAQPKIPETPKGTTVAGKTIIITGGNAGLGFEAARQFLVLGASRMILACRSLVRGQEAANKLRADPAIKTHNPAAKIDVFELDLDDYQSTLRFCQKVNNQVPELDILLNNAGLQMVHYEKSKSGHERTMQVNCYSHVLICLELLPLLQRTAAARKSPTRISFVGSSLQKTMAALNKTSIPDDTPIMDYFDNPANFSRLRHYADSKVLVHAYVTRLATLAPSDVVVNNLCPGIVETDLIRDIPAPLRVVLDFLRKAVARNAEEGARTLIYAAAVVGPETNGRFLDHNEVTRYVLSFCLLLKSLQ